MCIRLRRLPLVLPTSGPLPRVLGCGLTSQFGELKTSIKMIDHSHCFEQLLIMPNRTVCHEVVLCNIWYIWCVINIGRICVSCSHEWKTDEPFWSYMKLANRCLKILEYWNVYAMHCWLILFISCTYSHWSVPEVNAIVACIKTRFFFASIGHYEKEKETITSLFYIVYRVCNKVII